MRYKIVADSSANVFALSDVDFASVSLKIITEDSEYVDDGTLDTVSMVADLETVKGSTGTSCPNAFDWEAAFEGADAVFAVTITSNLSGCYNAAMIGAEQYIEKNPDAKVCVLDTLSTGPEMQLIIEKLREMILSGMEYDEIVTAIKAYQERTHLLFSLESLANLARNGRVSHAVAKVVKVLGIRVVGAASAEGTLEPLHKARGEKKAIKAIFSEMESRGYIGGKVHIAHCFNENAAEQLKAMILSAYPESDVNILPCGGLCCFYAEKGGLLVGYESK
ncbi:MAG: DegV family protein [Firmicutes bacterium]|nr:DegV family protein [Bacillota bacterium]